MSTCKYDICLSADSVVGTLSSTIGRVTGIVQKFTFFLAGWTLIGMGVGFKGIPAIGAFPAGHNDHLLRNIQFTVNIYLDDLINEKFNCLSL
jgi:hypothetical protein